MKYCVHGFFQPRAVELGLTNDDLLVLRWFVDFVGTKKMKTIIIEDRVYYWVNYKTILEDLPVLKISVQTLRKLRFDNLCKASVLNRTCTKESSGTFSYYCYGINYDTLQYLQDPDAEQPKGKNDTPTGNKIPLPEVENYQARGSGVPTKDNNTIHPNTNTSIKKVSKPQSEITFDSIISNFTSIEELKTALVDFIKMRKLIKKPLTNRALELILSKLKNLASAESDQIAIINQSIVNSWQGIFPIKAAIQNQPGRQPFQKAAVNYDEE